MKYQITNRLSKFLGNAWDSPSLSREKIRLAKELRKYLNKPITIEYTPRLGVVKKQVGGILESFTISPYSLFTLGLLRRFNIISFRLKDSAKLVLVDGDTHDLNFIPIPDASGLVHNVKPL